jgi:hypothetical protein
MQYLQNTAVTVEYAGSYSSKEETPDVKFVENVFTKELAQMLWERNDPFPITRNEKCSR